MEDVAESNVCSYCGLPIHIRQAAANDSPAFCCLGCRLAAGIMSGDDQTRDHRQLLTRLGLAIFFTMNVMVFTLVLWTWNVHDITEDVRILAFREVLRYACLLFSAPVLILLGGPLLDACWKAIQCRQFTVDTLLLLGVCAAFGYSTASLLLGFEDVYFEVACMILVAVTLGKWLEATAKHKANQTLRSMRQLLPESVNLVGERGDDSSETTTIPLLEVRPGDLLRVLAGERIPVDGLIESTSCIVDEQLMTGESLPRTKERGEEVFGGTLNLAGILQLRATTSADQGAIARLMDAVTKATAAKCRTVRAADRLAAWFVPVICAASAVAFTWHFPLGLHNALMASLSVVLIACPCALGLATPLAIWVAINAAARRGVHFRGGDAVINLAKVRAIAFDKTGTITSGDIRLTEVKYENPYHADDLRHLARTLAGYSNHVLSRAVISHVEEYPTRLAAQMTLTEVQEFPGKGVMGVLRPGKDNDLSNDVESLVMLGSRRLAEVSGFSMSQQLASAIQAYPKHAIVCLGVNGKVEALFFLGEQLRTEALSVFQQLRHFTLQLAILTGDRLERAVSIEKLAGVPTTGELLPEDKAYELTKLKRPVAMVGDGINDTLALASADVGIALDCGADVSRETADICLAGSSIKQLPWAVSLVSRTQTTIHRNLFWAVAYNTIGIGIAVTGHLNPILAAVAMVGSSLFVLSNSLRLDSQLSTPESHENAVSLAGIALPTSQIEAPSKSSSFQDSTSQATTLTGVSP